MKTIFYFEKSAIFRNIAIYKAAEAKDMMDECTY
jgi:hypothetical protein